MNADMVLSSGNAKVFGKNFTLFSCIDSTNNYIKKLSPLLQNGHVVISDEQVRGRGRQGKNFYSPKDEGLYMSIILKEDNIVNDELFTVKICLAVCRAIDRITGTDNNNGVGIKWVNDIYFASKKLCGILCEKVNMQNGKSCVVAGIGVNLMLEKAKIPKDISKTATSLYDITKQKYDKFYLASLICECCEEIFSQNSSIDEIIDEYRKRSVIIGREINIIQNDKMIRAAALDICPDGALLVRTEEGFTQKLCGGEITIRARK